MEKFLVGGALVLVNALGATFVRIDEFGVIDAQQVQDGGMKIVHVESILHGVETEFVRCAVGSSALHAAASHPHGESRGVVVTSVALFAHGRASELAAPNHEGLFEETSCLEVGQQACDGFIDRAAEAGVVGFNAFVAVPFTSCTAVELDEADTVFDEASGEEAVSSEHSGFGAIHSVEVFRGVGFF